MESELKSPLCWQHWFLALLLLLCIAPFLAISAFAHPSADDWYMAADGRDMGFWGANLMFYRDITGRFFSSAVLYAHPMANSITAFKLYSAAVVFALVPTLRWALSAWFPSAPRVWKWMGGLAGAVLFIWSMPSTSQGFFWATGTTGYTVAALLTTCLAALLGRQSLDSTWRPGAGRLALFALLPIFITGCTEVAMALLLVHVLALNAVYLWRHRRISTPLLVVLIATSIGIAVVIASPGNDWRTTLYDNPVKKNLFPALSMAAKLALSRTASLVSFTPLILLSLIALAFWPQSLRQERRLAWETFIVAFVLLVGTLWGGFFIGTWTMGKALPPRAINLILFFFIIDWAVLLAAIAMLLRSYAVELPRLNAVSYALVLVILAASLRSPHNNIKTAWRDLLTGAAARYDRECFERYHLVRTSQADDVIIPPLSSKPRTIYFNDLRVDAQDWRNISFAKYFRKRSIALQPSNPVSR